MPSIAQLEKLLTLEPNDAFLLYGIAQEHAKLGAHDRAVEFFERTIAADPDYVYAYFHVARSLEALDRVPEALGHLETGLVAANRTGDAKGISEITGYINGLG